MTVMSSQMSVSLLLKVWLEIAVLLDNEVRLLSWRLLLANEFSPSRCGTAIVFGLDRSICDNKQQVSQKETGHVPHTGTLSHYDVNQ